MALANGTYPFTLTATQANGTSYTLSSDLVIGDDVIVTLGTVPYNVTLNDFEQDKTVVLGSINQEQPTLYEVLPVVQNQEIVITLGSISSAVNVNNIIPVDEANIIVILDNISHTPVLDNINPVNSGNDITVELGSISNSTTLYNATPFIVAPIGSLSDTDITRIVDAIFSRIIEGSETLSDQLKLIRAMAVGNITQVDNQVFIKDSSGLSNRIVATVSGTDRTINTTNTN